MRALLNFATLLLRSSLAIFRSRNEQAILELALRQQLATYARKQTEPKLTPLDRAFWVALSRFWPRWKENLVSVKPDTVVRWHRKGFRPYWRTISKRGPGRPRVSKEVQALIRRFAAERWVGSARRELLDHVIVFNERHLRCLLRDYVDYYNADRVHTQVGGLPGVGGIYHRYVWRAAA